MNQNAFHFVARANPGLTPLTNPTECAHLWQRLRLRFPKIFACVLMPNHLHILIHTSQPKDAKRALGIELRSWSRKLHPSSEIWTQVPNPTLIPNDLHLMRHIRYVHLNPCRSRLTKDPLMWEWSTHRDSSGCILSPWVDKNFLCQLFKTTPLDLEKIMHQYISGDPTVSVSGTPTLSDYNPDLPIRANLRIIFAATASAMRVEIDPKNKSLRNLTVHVADHLKIKVDPKELGLCRMTVYRILKAPKNLSKIQTILRTLNDPRTVPKINQHENVTVRNKN